MLLPLGLACDVCGAIVVDRVGATVHEFNVEGVEEDLHCCGGECFTTLEAVRLSGAFSDLPATSPLRLWVEGSDDPWATLRGGYSERMLH